MTQQTKVRSKRLKSGPIRVECVFPYAPVHTVYIHSLYLVPNVYTLYAFVMLLPEVPIGDQ